MTKVLVVASTFPSSDSDPVPAFVKDQVVAMRNADKTFEFHVLAPHDRRSNTKKLSINGHYTEHRFHYFWPFSFEKLAGRGIMPALKSNPFNYLLVPFLFIFEATSLLSLTKKIKPDVIYAHWFTPQAANALIVSHLTGTPYVFTTHAADVDVWRKVPVLGRLIVQAGTRKASALTAVSERSMQKLSNFFTDSEWKDIQHKTKIIPMGVLAPEKQINSSEVEHANSILFVGRLAEKKGVQFLLPAFKELLKKVGKASLTIAGDGPLLNQLKRQSNELGINSRVTFTGYVTGKEKEHLIRNASVFVVPSIITSSGDAEGLPVSLLEGLSYGKLCIATNESGADNIISDELNGYLIPQKDILALTRAMESALSMPLASRRRFQQAARELADQFTWEKIAKSHIDFLFKKED